MEPEAQSASSAPPTQLTPSTPTAPTAAAWWLDTPKDVGPDPGPSGERLATAPVEPPRPIEPTAWTTDQRAASGAWASRGATGGVDERRSRIPERLIMIVSWLVIGTTAIALVVWAVRL